MFRPTQNVRCLHFVLPPLSSTGPLKPEQYVPWDAPGYLIYRVSLVIFASRGIKRQRPNAQVAAGVPGEA